MSVRKRTWTTRNGERKEAWICDYTDQHGGRHIKTFDRKKDADAHAASVRVDIGRGVHTDSKMTVAEAGAKWLADCEAEKLERSTLRGYRQRLRDHIIPFIGSAKLSELTVPGVRDFERKLRAEGRSPAMMRKVLGDLGSLLADAQESGQVAQNVAHSRSRRRKRRGQADRRHKPRLKVGQDIPTPEEIRAINAHLKGRWRPLIMTAIFTGLRASELRGLRWEDVDLKRGELHVRQRADRFNMIGSPKSPSARRTVRLPPNLLNTLREWKLRCVPSVLDLTFPNTQGNVESLANIVQRGFEPAQVAAGVTAKDGTAKYKGLHALRHFHASWCINRKEEGGLGLPPKVVQHRLGHSSIVMTLDTYGHLFPSGDDAAELEAAERALVG
jgi:integrase